MDSFATRLNKALEKAEKTPAELSKMTGIPEGTISHYRSGKYEPKQRRLHVIAKALNTTPAYLMGWGDANQPDDLTLGAIDPDDAWIAEIYLDKIAKQPIFEIPSDLKILKSELYELGYNLGRNQNGYYLVLEDSGFGVTEEEIYNLRNQISDFIQFQCKQLEKQKCGSEPNF